MIRPRSLALATALLLWTGATAAQAATWVVDPATSVLGFTGSQSGKPFDGIFTKWSAKIDYDPANPAAAKVVVTIDTASATADEPQKDEALPESDWFDVAQFPQAKFEANGFKPKGGNAFEAPSKLTIRGISKDVVLPFTLAINGDNAHAIGKLPIIRTDYGVGQGQFADGKTVALEVAVTLDIWAKKAP